MVNSATIEFRPYGQEGPTVASVWAVLAAAADGCRPVGGVPPAALAGRLPPRLAVEYSGSAVLVEHVLGSGGPTPSRRPSLFPMTCWPGSSSAWEDFGELFDRGVVVVTARLLELTGLRA